MFYLPAAVNYVFMSRWYAFESQLGRLYFFPSCQTVI